MGGNIKLICGLVWTLILHYSISLPMWEGEDDYDSGMSPKQRLLTWINNKIPDNPVSNFTSDWNSGKAIGALVDAIAPGLCPDWVNWDPKNALENATTAMNLASKWLNIPQLIKPEEMINPKVDDLSMMTYLSQFPNAKLKDGAPLKGVTRVNPSRVRVFGPGVQPTGVVVGAPTNFTIETFSAGNGKIEVGILNPQGKLEPVEVKFNDDRSKTYTCTYTAKMEGDHHVVVKFAGADVPKSPFTVKVEGHAGDASKVKVNGAGIVANGVQVGKPTSFEVDTTGAGKGQVDVVILDPKGKPSTALTRLQKVPDTEKYVCEYVPQSPGVHSVNVFFAGKPVPNSPFGVRVAPACDTRKVRASGRGLQSTGVRVGDIADFKVYTEGAGEGVLQVKLIGPEGKEEKINIKKTSDTVFDCDYAPTKIGKYTVIVSFGGQEIFRSPYEVNVGPYRESKIKAFGPGLKGGIVGYPAKFTVDTCGETGTLGFTVEGPSQVKIECQDNGDGSANVTYWPTAPGEYAIHILSDREDIPKSPYIAQILPKTDYYPEKVTASGPGLQSAKQAVETEFTVDPRKGGQAPLEVSIVDKNFKELPIKATKNKDETCNFKYTPEVGGRHVVQINYGGVGITQSPVLVEAETPFDPSKIKVSGNGIKPGLQAGQQANISVDCKEAGKGKLEVSFRDEGGRNIAAYRLTNNGDGTYSVEYTVPNRPYSVVMSYGGKPVPGFPLPMSPEGASQTQVQTQTQTQQATTEQKSGKKTTKQKEQKIEGQQQTVQQKETVQQQQVKQHQQAEKIVKESSVSQSSSTESFQSSQMKQEKKDQAKKVQQEATMVKQSSTEKVSVQESFVQQQQSTTIIKQSKKVSSPLNFH